MTEGWRLRNTACWGIGAGAGAAIGGAAAAAGSLGSSALSSSAASSASKQQQAAALQAQQTQEQELAYQQQLVSPNVQLGTWAADTLGNELGITPASGGTGTGALTQQLPSWSPTEQQLQSTPGYQFTEQQGLEAAQNGFASQGLASSGSAVKGALSYAEGLADTTYQQQFNNYLSTNAQTMANESQIAGLLGSVAGSGQNAALGLAADSSNTNSNVSSEQLASGAAQAAGTVGSANATAGGISSAFNNLGSGISTAALLQSLGGGSGGATTLGGQTPQSGYTQVGNSPTTDTEQ